MARAPLTLMAVHAHPDDEATSTGGILARYAAEGVRTVLVTCTNGELGDGPDGSKPDAEGHDQAEVVATRRRELAESARLLKIGHLEMLGYRDSGMMGWATNDAPGAFWSMDVETAARPLADLMRGYQPDVVITYDDFGFYGHPDHIQAHRITLAAMDQAGSKADLYYPTFRRSIFPLFAQRMREAGLEAPDADESQMGVPDELVAVSIDVRDLIDTKLAAVRAHVSQGLNNQFFLRLSHAVLVELFGVEEFVRPRGPAPGPVPDDDLFARFRDRVAR